METSSLPEQRCREESFPLLDSPLWLAGKGHRPLTSLCLCSIDGKDPDFPGHRRCFIALKSAWRGSPWPGRSHISRKSPHCDAAFVVEHCPGYFFPVTSPKYLRLKITHDGVIVLYQSACDLSPYTVFSYSSSDSHVGTVIWYLLRYI